MNAAVSPRKQRPLFLNKALLVLAGAISGRDEPSRLPDAGLEARIVCKTLDGDAPAQFVPAVLLHEAGEDHFEGDAVQGVLGLLVGHWFLIVYPNKL